MEQSRLWQQTFSDITDPNVSRLATSLRVARDRVNHLTSRIVTSLPSLTMHDLSHLDGLWNVAGTIAGDNFRLNPLEGYIFGTAVLLHDAALCFEAYKGGQQAVRDSIQWRDAHNRCKHNQAEVDLDAVDFEALRSLHAAQAARLATDPWDTEDGQQYIIDDDDLRNQYGLLIGEIASSHHWNIDYVADKLSIPRPPAAFLPKDWTADSLLLACLLRIADAGHMDSSRAPTFLLRVLEMNSISKAHWVAQNHLGHLTSNVEDPTQLVVSSTAPFGRNEAQGWWVAFDLVAQLDKELRQCEAVLASSTTSSRSFKSKSVAGAGNVIELTKFIQTKGWVPTNSSIHVSDVTALVSKLGGEQLYGAGADRLLIALRELVQNASDAISARRLVGNQPNFEGQIWIRLLHNSSEGCYILQVDDDGVGMSSTTLCEELLDFGKSFWASERASQEFPGLHAAGHSPRGRFGIGFFSIFMAADSVNVYSRRYDRGLQELRCLSFDNGLSLRPILTTTTPTDVGMNISTRVELKLKRDLNFDPQKIEIRCNVAGHQNFHVPFTSYVAALVSGVDVCVSVEVEDQRKQIHRAFPPNASDRIRWLNSLSYVSAGVNSAVEEFAKENVSRLREIRNNGNCYGLAAISVNRTSPCDFLSAKAVGGIVTHDTTQPFIGLIEHLPNNASRGPGEIAAPKNSMKSWLSEQVKLLEGRLSLFDSIHVSYSLSAFDYDPIDVLQGILVVTLSDHEIWLLQDLSRMLVAGNRLAFRVSDYGVPFLEQHGEQSPVDGFATCLVLNTGRFNSAEMSMDGPKEPYSLIGVIHRVLVAQGANPTWTTHRRMYRGLFGKCDGLEVRI